MNKKIRVVENGKEILKNGSPVKKIKLNEKIDSKDMEKLLSGDKSIIEKIK